MTELGERFEDERGWIQNLDACGWASIIISKANTRRSSHWHQTDAHTLYVISGEMHYYERPVGSTEEPAARIIGEGEKVFTGSGMEHWTFFPVETVLVSVSTLNRTKANHEADLVRVPWHE